MIPNKYLNTIYLSNWLLSTKRFAASGNALINLIAKYEIPCKFIKATKDIWCRDYMPIQIEKENFLQFRYEPTYLKNDLEFQSDPKRVCKANGITATFSKINLDGGNVVNWSDRAIITDRIFDENPEYTNKNNLISEIENLLEVEIIVIPQIKSDITGHVDGLVRFVDRDTVLGNDREQEFKYWKNRINKILKEHGIEFIDIPFLEYRDKKHPYHAIGCYVNYLEISNLIVLPVFEIDICKDDEVVKRFEQIFPDRKIETINYNAIGIFGGLLNCTTWAILE